MRRCGQELDARFMRVDLFLPVTSTEEALRFYVDELALFELRLDYGMDTYLIAYKRNPSLCLNLHAGELHKPNSPLFALEVENCIAEFQRMREVAFTKGGFVNTDRASQRVFEYPLGKSFLMHDPFGNRFLIIEGY